MHCVLVYDHLKVFRQEIRAMLYVRGMMDKKQYVQGDDDSRRGVRPGIEDTKDAEAARAWLDENIYTLGNDSERRKLTTEGQLRICISDDAMASRRAQDGLRVLHDLEQFTAWAYLWATDWLELRWLGMEVGFGIFIIGEHPHSGPLHIGAVADYEFEDPHTVVRVQATKSDRAAGDCTNDYVAVYGPMALVNAACKTHSNVGFKDADIRLSGKQVWLEWMLRTKSVCAGTQLLAAYPATAGHQWLCPGFAGSQQCCTIICSDVNKCVTTKTNKRKRTDSSELVAQQ